EAANKILALESKSVKGGITYNCGIINGGTMSNIVPERCEITVDVRVSNGEELENAKAVLEEIANESFDEGTKTELVLVSQRQPMLHNEDTENLFLHLKTISEKYGLGTLVPIESGGGSDSAYTQLAGVPSVCAVGATGDFCHTINEYADIDSLALRAKLLAAATLEME
ncbi:MAG: M20/M25/M40 family metallo-hydrolase, partial [Clostridia bacterium]|nr:M20/M25/M40 family metallo-hydrolase [Clostridia bacterium]